MTLMEIAVLSWAIGQAAGSALGDVCTWYQAQAQ